MTILLASTGCMVNKKPNASAKQQQGAATSLSLPPAGGFGDFSKVADAVPRYETPSATGNKPYVVYGRSYHPIHTTAGFVQRGKASWYGEPFHGRKTSSGEVYDMYQMTAAHRTLPIPSYAKVRNLHNSMQVVVRINDRGPFVNPDARVIDLSYVAASKLGILDAGTAEVEIQSIHFNDANASVQPVTTTSPPLTLKYYLQLGAFSHGENANKLTTLLENVGVPTAIMSEGALYKVRSGPYTSVEAASAAKVEIFDRTGLESSLVVLEGE